MNYSAVGPLLHWRQQNIAMVVVRAKAIMYVSGLQVINPTFNKTCLNVLDWGIELSPVPSELGKLKKTRKANSMAQFPHEKYDPNEKIGTP